MTAHYAAAGHGSIQLLYDLALNYLQQGDNANTKKAVVILCEITEQTASVNKLDMTLKLEAAYILWQLWSGNNNPDGQVKPGKAFQYLRYAAERGLAKAERDLGIAYIKGLFGHPVDLHSGERWLVKAKEKGDKKAVETLQNLPNYVCPAKDTESTNCKESEKEFLLDSLTNSMEARIKQRIENNTTPISVLRTADKEQTINRMTLQAYQQFPTARLMLKVWDLYDDGFKLMLLSIDGSSKEGFLKGAELWAEARACSTASIFESRLYPVERENDLVFAAKHYAEGNPENFILQYFYIRMKERTMSNIDFPVSKHISEREVVSHKAENFPRPFSKLTTVILAGIYYDLGSLYCVTDQLERALHSFEKCYDMDPVNQSEALYGMAYQLINDRSSINEFKNSHCKAIGNNSTLTPNSTERAESLLHKFLEVVPKCTRKYAHAHFQLAIVFMLKREMRKMIYYYEKGVEADDNRLPFLSACDIPAKAACQGIVDFIRSKYCSNPDCQVETQDVKKCTACGFAVYCSKECQKVHWKRHKKVCASKQK